jgi:hypothetical protein
MEHTAADAIVGDLTEPSFDRVQSGAAGRCEVQMKARASFQPALDRGVLVRGVVVEDQVQVQPRRGETFIPRRIDETRPKGAPFDQHAYRKRCRIKQAFDEFKECRRLGSCYEYSL